MSEQGGAQAGVGLCLNDGCRYVRRQVVAGGVSIKEDAALAAYCVPPCSQLSCRNISVLPHMLGSQAFALSGHLMFWLSGTHIFRL